MASFSFCELQLVLVSLLVYNSYMSWSTRFFSKTACGVFHFDFVSCLLKFVFYSTLDSLTLKRHNSFQNKKNRKVTHSLAPRPLIFKLQQEVKKIQYPRELPKNWAGDIFFKFRKSKFWERQFFSIVTFKKIFDTRLLINLFISLIEPNNIH